MDTHEAHTSGGIFCGFDRSNTTPIPDILFDALLVKLSGAELKILLYIMRRTWGFKKDSDAISISQFQHGIVTRNGVRLDNGCGIKRRQTIIDTLVLLEVKGYIVSRKSKESVGDNAVTVYCIRFKEGVSKEDHPASEDSFKNGPPVVSKEDHGGFKRELPVVSKGDHGGPIAGPQVVSKGDPQETDQHQTGLHQTDQQDTLSPDKKKSRLLSSATPQVQALVSEWKVCYKAFADETRRDGSVRVNKTLIDHATTLVVEYGLLPGELAQHVKKMRAKDRKGWYIENGLHLGNVVNEVKKNPPERSPDDAPHIGMTRQEFDEVKRDIQSVGLYLLCAQDIETELYYIGIADSDTSQIDINRPDDWYKLPYEKLTRAWEYVQSLQKTG